MSTEQKMCTVMDLPTSILASLFALLMFAGLPSHFPLSTVLNDRHVSRFLQLILNTLP